MVNSEDVASEIAEAVREVLGPNAQREAQTVAKRALQRLRDKGLEVAEGRGAAARPWMPDYR